MNAEGVATVGYRRRKAERPRNRNRPSDSIELGQYIVADPRVCHGKPTFKGTRIMVWQVLNDVAKGKDWDFIAQRQWGGHISKEGIAEAVRLAGCAWLDREGRLIAHRNSQRKQPLAA
jgi:uncharacterized protein (DUF433 family)